MSTTRNVDYVGMFKVAGIASMALVIATLVGLFTKGLNYGVDFRGGVEIQVKFNQKTELGNLREFFAEKKVPVSQLQSIGDESQNEFLLKLETEKNADLNAVSNQVGAALTEKFGAGNFEILK